VVWVSFEVNMASGSEGGGNSWEGSCRLQQSGGWLSCVGGIMLSDSHGMALEVQVFCNRMQQGSGG